MNNGELLSLIHCNITVSVPKGIYYHYILICLDLTHFTYSNYVLCNSNWDTHISVDLDLVEAKLGHYALFQKCQILIHSFLLSHKGPHRNNKKKKSGDIDSGVLQGDKSISCFLPLPSCPVAFLRLGASQ